MTEPQIESGLEIQDVPAGCGNSLKVPAIVYPHPDNPEVVQVTVIRRFGKIIVIGRSWGLSIQDTTLFANKYAVQQLADSQAD